MTYKELSKELGINSSKLMSLENEGLLKGKNATALLGNFDEDDVRIIRLCCLFSMLGLPDDEIVSIMNGEIDLRATLKKHVDAILSDDSNHSQAAIVMQNIRRECTTIEEMDPVPFLQHVKELKHTGGIFYDVNTARLDKEKSQSETLSGRASERNSGSDRRYGFFGSFLNNDQNPYNYERSDKDARTSTEDNYADTAVSPNEMYDEKEADTASAEGAFTEEKSTNNADQTEGPELYDSAETTTNKSSGYDENWSPYTDRGFGASNMGAGNWHGWSPGYGTYSAKVEARARINNGEKTCPHPFRRFAARMIDAMIVTLIVGAVMKLVFRINIGISLTMAAYVEVIFWAVELLIEPILLTSVGTTPGKWIMGITVRDMKTKGKLDLKQAYIRSLKLAWYGFGFMIPLLTVFMRVMSFMRCRINDTMRWDEGIDIELKDEAIPRIVLCIMLMIILNVGDDLISKQALIPKNRGNITSEQFYENVVEIMKYTGYAGDIPKFELNSRNGYVNSVKLVYTDEDSNTKRYDEMYIGFLAFAGAAEGSNAIKIMFSQAIGQMKSYYVNFNDSYCGVSISNSSDSEITDQGSYSLLFSMLYGTEVSIPAFNQTFIMSK